MIENIIPVLGTCAGLAATGGFIAAGYVKAPPDKAFIISVACGMCICGMCK